MLEKPDFEQDYWSKTSQGVYKVGLDPFRLMEWLTNYERSFYRNITYDDLLGSVLKYIKKFFLVNIM